MNQSQFDTLIVGYLKLT